MSAEERRQQLTEVGLALFAQQGFEATSVEEIAEAAGITKPVVYEHFGGKDGLYQVVVDREIAAVLERVTSSLDAEHPRRVVEQAADAFLTYIEERPDGFRLLARDAPVGGGHATFASLIGEVAERVTDVFTRHLRAGGYHTRYAALYARALVGMVALVGEWWLTEAEGPSRATVRAHLVNLAWNGLKDLDPDPTRRRA